MRDRVKIDIVPVRLEFGQFNLVLAIQAGVQVHTIDKASIGVRRPNCNLNVAIIAAKLLDENAGVKRPVVDRDCFTWLTLHPSTVN